MLPIVLAACLGFTWPQPPAKTKGKRNAPADRTTGVVREPPGSTPPANAEFTRYGIYALTAPRAQPTAPVATALPLKLEPGDRIALVGNGLLERSQDFGHLEGMLQRRHAGLRLTVRNLAWSADEVGLQPRPANFADLEQHLVHERIDVIVAAFGFNESFAGEAGLPGFRERLGKMVAQWKASAFNGKTGPRIVLVSPTANENLPGVPAADLNNARIARYAEAIRAVAREQQVAFVDAFAPTRAAMAAGTAGLTSDGAALTDAGHALFAEALFRGAFGDTPPTPEPALRAAIVDKDKQFFRRYRPLNTFYYTGGRNRDYGYLDFLPAMRNYDLLTENRDRRIWALAAGRPVPPTVDDTNVPALPAPRQERGVNEWLSAADERKAFKVDPRFEVNLFAGEERFPELANPIQMRWDSRGRLWVSCSNNYPHAYPGKEPNDKLVILEDTDGDGQADQSTVFADGLHLPLSFEFGDGGVYVSEQPNLTFLKDTNGDGKADLRRVVLAGFGTEDSHHALHDFVWTPDGDLLFRESVFHHSQVETPYGPVRQQNSGWFRYEPDTHRLTSFGSYASTNPWGVTFDDWGQHVASHPIYAAAFHAPDPAYPQQHPPPRGLQAYSGTCGQEFLDFPNFPAEVRGMFAKVRYKPTNRVELHRWKEGPFGYQEEYVSDLLFSTNLSFIPVDLGFGPRGDLYVCDWYNPVKGHAQYSLRDERRDRRSGRIWRIVPKDFRPQEAPRFAELPIPALLELLKRPEYRIRYWAKRELRERNRPEALAALEAWAKGLERADPRFRHHQMEAVWACRWLRGRNLPLLRELLACDDHHARAAAVQQLRHWHADLPDAVEWLRKAANDPNGIVRMEAALACSYVGTPAALEALLETGKHPRGGHLEYAIATALGSRTMKPLWEHDSKYAAARKLATIARGDDLKEPRPTAEQTRFDRQRGLKVVAVSCLAERMLFSATEFHATPGQPVKLVLTNPDATEHNLVIVKPGALAEVGMAANDMAKDPRNALSDFLPPQKKSLILQATPLIGPTRAAQVAVLRFNAPTEPGVYPYVCTYPGHWIVMNGSMVVAKDRAEADRMLAAQKPALVRAWTMADFPEVKTTRGDAVATRGLQAFVKANCHQCHAVGGHGVDLGPELCCVGKKHAGAKLLKQLLEPSAEIDEKYRSYAFELADGRKLVGVILKEEAGEYHVAANLLAPTSVTRVRKADVERKTAATRSPMPDGLLNVLTREEILDLVSFLEAGYAKPGNPACPETKAAKR